MSGAQSKSCNTCLHAGVDVDSAVFLYCRRYPPAPASYRGGAGQFPKVEPDWFCGEWVSGVPTLRKEEET